MFVLVSEWIRKNGGRLRSVIAVDPIPATPFIDAYFDLLRVQATEGSPAIQATYLCDLSTSIAVKEIVEQVEPSLVFIDGDHQLRGVLSDYILVRDRSQIIVLHDVSSQSCPDSTFTWKILKKLERNEFEFYEFTNQYQSVRGNFLGIGVMKRISTA